MGIATIAEGINDSGQIVGYYTDSSNVKHGFLYSGGSNGTYTTLNDPSAAGSTLAYGINNAGQIVGVYPIGGIWYGFLDSGGTYTTLALAGYFTSFQGINDSGQIVGSYEAASGIDGFTAFGSPPMLSSVAATASFGRLGPATTLSPGLTVADLGSSTLASATVAITGGEDAGDVLSANTTGTSITASYNSTTETLTLSGTDTLADYQAVLRTVSFNSTNQNPTNFGFDPSRTITWVVNDGSTYYNLSTAPITTLGITGGLVAPLPAGTTADLIARNTIGIYAIYDIGNNSFLAAGALGQVGLEWQVAGLGGFYGTDTTDMILRDSNNGAFEVYDISHNIIISAAIPAKPTC